MIPPVSGETVHVRAGQLEDLARVQEFTTSTFRWGDYVPGAWAGWVRSKRGDLLVAEWDGQIVGTIHVRYLENSEAWLEGVRVRRQFRRRGVAGLLMQAAHEHARARNCRVIRLETGLRNVAAQRAFEKFGYKRVAQYASFESRTAPTPIGAARPAKLEDVAACWELWTRSGVKRSSRSIVPAAYGWRWWEFTRSRLSDEVRAQRVWVAPRGFMILRPDDDSWDVVLLVGRKRAACELLNTARRLTHAAGMPKVFWLVPLTVRSHEWARAACFTLDQDDLLIYALDL
jgi:ribosomal protein S18 acetylase RimI-like enzyme